MTLTNSSRKRECSDESEYLPVTKRMNNLHIDVSSNQLKDLNVNNSGQQLNGLEFGLESNQINHNYQTHNCVNGMIDSNNSSKVYSPELNSNQNPIYYESNRVLYEAHQQRILRTTITSRDLFIKKT